MIGQKKAPRGNSYTATFLRQNLNAGAPALAPEPADPAPANINGGDTTIMPAAPPEALPAAKPAETRPRRVLDAGEEAHLDRKRKKKRIAGLIRGGRNSPDWEEPSAWSGGKIPERTKELEEQLALGHKLNVWQVRVEAIDLFLKKHGLKSGAKD